MARAAAIERSGDEGVVPRPGRIEPARIPAVVVRRAHGGNRQRAVDLYSGTTATAGVELHGGAHPRRVRVTQGSVGDDLGLKRRRLHQRSRCCGSGCGRFRRRPIGDHGARLCLILARHSLLVVRIVTRARGVAPLVDVRSGRGHEEHHGSQCRTTLPSHESIVRTAWQTKQPPLARWRLKRGVGSLGRRGEHPPEEEQHPRRGRGQQHTTGDERCRRGAGGDYI